MKDGTVFEFKFWHNTLFTYSGFSSFLLRAPVLAVLSMFVFSGLILNEVFFGPGLIVQVVLNLLSGLIISPLLAILHWGVFAENVNRLSLRDIC